jgi:hypothetical protein
MNRDKVLTERVLGETVGTVQLQDIAAIRKASTLMAAQATRELRIFSRDLDPAVYNHEDFLTSVRRLALHSERSAIEILVFDAEPVVRHRHGLLDLAHQVPSHIRIRRIPTEFHFHLEAYLIADTEGYVLRPVAEVFEGRTDFSAPRQVRQLRNEFEHIWERSDQPLDLISFGRGL